MQRNDELIDRVLGYIERHPEEWYQGNWFSCKTTACFAGRTLLMSGYRIIDTTFETAANVDLFGYLSQYEMVDPDNNIIGDYAYPAQELLGLPYGQARMLFDGTIETIDELRTIVANIRAGKPVGEVECTWS